VSGDGQRRERGDVVGPRQRLVDAALALHEAEPEGLLARVRLGRQQHGPGRTLTGQIAQALHRPLIDHETELRGRDAEGGIGGGAAQVACGRELGAGAEGSAFDGGERGERRRPESDEHLVQQFHECPVFHAGQVSARTEVAPGAAHHQDARVGRGLGDSGQECPEGVVVDGVASLGSVDGEHPDVGAVLDVDHGCRPSATTTGPATAGDACR
jgi:hypothetical protein